MYSIASLLDPASAESVRALWARLEASCGLTGIQETPLPHFSWMSADSFLFAPLEHDLHTLAMDVQPFSVRTSGLGIFTGSFPVIYLPVIKNAALIEAHERIWRCARPYAVVPNGYYEPRHWVPHVTLAYREIDAGRLACGIADMAFQKVELEIRVDHLALIYHTAGQGGIRNQFLFQKGKEE